MSGPGTTAGHDGRDDGEVVRFWEAARARAGVGRLGAVTGTSSVMALPPPAWRFGSSPAEADELLGLVLAGTKTATSSLRRELEAVGAPLPQPGELSVVLDGRDHPRALLRTTAVRVVPFGEVDEAHAHAEGEGDRSLAGWREAHRRAFDLDGSDEEVEVVLERFELLHPRPDPDRAATPR